MPEKASSKKILVIDHDLTVLDFIKEELEFVGYNVTISTNSNDGLEKVVDEFYDIIIVELLMPKVDGFTFIKKLREMEAESDIIAMSGGRPTNSIENCIFLAERLNIYDFLAKPIENTHLLELVNDITGIEIGPIIFEDTDILDIANSPPINVPHNKNDAIIASDTHIDTAGRNPDIDKSIDQDIVLIKDDISGEDAKTDDGHATTISYTQVLDIIRRSDQNNLTENELWILNHISQTDELSVQLLGDAWSEYRKGKHFEKGKEYITDDTSDFAEWSTWDSICLLWRTNLKSASKLILIIAGITCLLAGIIYLINAVSFSQNIDKENSSHLKTDNKRYISGRELFSNDKEYDKGFKKGKKSEKYLHDDKEEKTDIFE